MRRSGSLLFTLAYLLAGTPGSAHDDDPERPVQIAGDASKPRPASDSGRRWRAGDHHVHSRFSVKYEPNPADISAVPTPVLGGDGRNPIPRNAAMARKFGLEWMASTDHGGPNHSKINAEQAYPELLQSRRDVPGLIQFYAMEFDTPGGDHSSLLIPRTKAERDTLLDLESRFSKREPWPADPSRDREPLMLDALRAMDGIAARPVVIANHPSRSATGIGLYALYNPAEFRAWNDAAPKVAIGMEGAPGHQADALNADGLRDATGTRGNYRRSPTLGGFDQMTARLGGFWDSMLGEGRRWWVTATSDSHRHYTEGGDDFWPGEYAKTYVHARADPADILDGLREGRVFVTTGDLISELDMTVGGATIGGAVDVPAGSDVTITIRLRDPAGANAAGKMSRVARVDLIVGDVTGPRPDRDGDTNPSTRVIRRFTAADWTAQGEVLMMTHVVSGLTRPSYIRVRGTSGGEAEPQPDPAGEDPWSDLWFYGNPVFVTVR